MERRYLSYRHAQQFGIEVHRLLVVALYGFGRQLVIDVLREEFLHEHRERPRDPGYHSASLRQFLFLLFIDPPVRLGSLGLTLGREPGP